MDNIEVKKAALDLVYLVSCAVNGIKPDPERCSGMDVDEVFRLARRHSLTVAAALALEKAVQLPPDFKEAKFMALRRLTLYDIERKRILSAFDAAGIWYLPLKGAVLNERYPKLIMREMSDNDILCDKARMADIKTLMGSFGYTCKHYGEGCHDVYKKDIR